jgi:chromosomal replication initiator protein
MWFNMEYDSSTESSIILAVPSSFYRDRVKAQYQSMIENKLHELSGLSLRIEFVIKPRTVRAEPQETGNVQEPVRNSQNLRESQSTRDTNLRDVNLRGANAPAAAPVQSDYILESRSTPQMRQITREIPTEKKGHPLLRADYTFDNFVVGDNSSFVYNAALAIAKNPGVAYNPCLIYGGVGLGKTHIIQAVGNYINEVSNKKIVYTTAENFTNEFIQAIQDKKTKEFKNKYRSADVLLIDDIHFLQKKVETQEELFHTFNALYESNKQLIFTCDRHISEIKDISERLASRFTRGLNADIQIPNFETRCAILKKKAEYKNSPMLPEVIEYIANNAVSNVRDLEACLIKLIAYGELTNQTVTLEIAKKELKDTISSKKDINVSIDVIQKVVANSFNISYQDMKSKKRTRAIALPRQIAMYIAREITEYSTTELGMEFGGRDHTTVMHACQKIDEKLRSDPTLEPRIVTLIQEIKK